MLDVGYIGKVLVDKTVVDLCKETFEDKVGLGVAFPLGIVERGCVAIGSLAFEVAIKFDEDRVSADYFGMEVFVEGLRGAVSLSE